MQLCCWNDEPCCRCSPWDITASSRDVLWCHCCFQTPPACCSADCADLSEYKMGGFFYSSGGNLHVWLPVQLLRQGWVTKCSKVCSSHAPVCCRYVYNMLLYKQEQSSVTAQTDWTCRFSAFMQWLVLTVTLKTRQFCSSCSDLHLTLHYKRSPSNFVPYLNSNVRSHEQIDCWL